MLSGMNYEDCSAQANSQCLTIDLRIYLIQQVIVLPLAGSRLEYNFLAFPPKP